MAGPARRLPEPAAGLMVAQEHAHEDSTRLPLIDALKAGASQLIVLHHLAFYGPMSDAVRKVLPAPLDWLSQHARIAVQLFLVVGGFLAARSLAPNRRLVARRPLILVWRRYLKLALPYLVALVLAIAAAALARHAMAHPATPDAPTPGQLLAHALLLQDILGLEALSAGVWYVAIDFQLFSLLLVLLWVARGADANAVGLLLVAGFAIASLYHFNRDAAGDAWAPYFFGAYALGALAFWASAKHCSPHWTWAIGAIAAGALLLDFRTRLAVALATAMLLAIGRRNGLIEAWPRTKCLDFLSRISFSVFLVHYPVCLVVNTAVTNLHPDNPVVNALGMLAAWIASIGAGWAFYRAIEQRVVGSAGATATRATISPPPTQSR